MGDSEQQLNHEVIALLDEFLETHHDERTLFLKISRKRIAEFRGRFQALQDQSLADQSSDDQASQALHGGPGQRKVFVALYLADGNNLQQWKAVLKSLASKVIGRPVYTEEAHAQQAIRERGNSQQEAYVSAYINESDILQNPSSQGLQDRAGHPLLTLIENAITSERIDTFVHGNQNRYVFRNGQLVLSD